MIKCPFCQYQNEEGALFCEQCKSDLAVESASASAGGAPAMGAESPSFQPAGAHPVGEIPTAEPILADTIPLADIGAMPVVSEETPPIALEEAPPTMPAPTEPLAEQAPPTVAEPAAPTAPAAGPLPADARVRLLVIRGQKINTEYPVYPGLNFIGRTDEKPVDIDLEDQESPDRVWSSRQHACISFENGILEIEDLNSANGTFVNRTRVYPGQKRQLNVNDVVQIGTVHLRVVA